MNKKEEICWQIYNLERKTPGGLYNYLERGRRLLESSMKGENPFVYYRPEIPSGVFLKPG